MIPNPRRATRICLTKFGQFWTDTVEFSYANWTSWRRRNFWRTIFFGTIFRPTFRGFSRLRPQGLRFSWRWFLFSLTSTLTFSFVLPRDGPPLNLLGAPLTDHREPVLPWINRSGENCKFIHCFYCSWTLHCSFRLVFRCSWTIKLFFKLNVCTEQFIWRPSKLQFPLFPNRNTMRSIKLSTKIII